MKWTRKLWAVPFLLSLSVTVTAVSRYKEFPLYDFSGGLNSNYSSLTIADNEVKSALNVYFTKDNAVSKRKGYTLYASTGSVSFSNSWSFVDSTNNAWLIARSSDAIRASPGNGSFTILIATVPPSTTSVVSAVNAFGKIFFVDNVQGVYSWDGTTVKYISGSPKGTIITEFHGYLWVAGISVPNQNYLYKSAYLDGETWTVGTLATSPALYQVGLNDRSDGITALYSGYNDVLYIFKNLSINALTGFDQTDFTVRTLTRDAGCIDQGSLQAWRGYLVFMSRRGLEQFDGYQCTRISDKVKDKVDPATLTNFNQRTYLGTGADFFNAGTKTPSTGTVVTSDGILQLSTSVVQTTWGYPTNILTSLYTCPTNMGGMDMRSSYYVSESIVSTYTFTLTSVVLNLEKFGSGWNWTVNFLSDNAATPGTILSSATLNMASVPTSHADVDIPLPSVAVSSGTRYWVQLKPGAGMSSCPSDYMNWYGYNGIVQEALYFGSTSFVGLQSVKLVGKVYPSTASWKSSAINIGSNINSWGSFQVNQNLLSSGTIAYAICVSSSSTMYPQVCTAQSPNSQIISSTGSYAQVIATFTATSSSQNPNLTSFTLNWSEGAPRPSMSSVVYDNRYWLSFATSTADNFNEAVLVMDQKSQNNIFTLFDINAGTLLLYRGGLYHGDSNANGKFYLDDIGYNDGGKAISSYVVTKDFNLGDINHDKIFHALYVMMDPSGHYSFSSSYVLDRYTTLPFSLSDVFQDEGSKVTNISLPFPNDSSHQNFGKTISFTFGNSVVDQSFNFYGGTLEYLPRSYGGNLNAQ